MKETILKKLKEIEQKENVRILFAVESGSRAWGFESKDSDYDVRFVYARRMEDYLRLKPVRDVIEWQLDETLDINGWDLRKALCLTSNSNPTFFEWIDSPIVYYSTEEFDWIKKIIYKCFNPLKGVKHYLSMAQHNYRDYLKHDKVRLKKYFYVLRALLCARYVVETKKNPPVLFTDLFSYIRNDEVKDCIIQLMEKKKSTSELGLADHIPVLDEYILSLMSELENVQVSKRETSNSEELDELFLKIVKGR